MVSFDEYWASEGARFYADSHEARALHAWNAAIVESEMLNWFHGHARL